MYKILLGILLLSASFAQANETAACTQGNCPVQIISPEIKNLPCGGATETLTFTLISQVGAIPIDGKKLVKINSEDTSSGSTLAFAGGTCGNSIPAGATGCTINVLVTSAVCPVSKEAEQKPNLPQQIAYNLEVSIDANPPVLIAPIKLKVTSSFLAVAINSSILSLDPLLVVHDATGKWNQTPTGIPTSSGTAFYAATCTGNDDKGICLLGGASSPEVPLLYRSSNGGINWNQVPAADITLPAAGAIEGVACTDEGSAATCIAVGVDATGGNFIPLMFTSPDGGASWSPVDFSTFGFSNDSYLITSACANNAGTVVCTAVGFDSIHSRPILLVFNPAHSPSVKKIRLPASVSLTSTACTEQGVGKIVCIAAGSNSSGSVGYLAVSIDSGVTWHNWTPQPTNTAELLYGTACTKATNGKVVCTATGASTSTTQAVVYMNTDVFKKPLNNWKQVVEASGKGYLTTTACETNAKTVCTAAGATVSPSVSPLFYVNNDVTGNGTWQTVPSVTANVFGGTACTNTGFDTIACIVAGDDATGNGLLYQNTDVSGIGSWSPVTFNPVLSNQCFQSAGASGQLSGGTLIFGTCVI